MSSLPAPPSSLSNQSIRLLFVECFPGDAKRGFVPGYHFQIFDRKSRKVGHLNVRVGDTEHIRLAAGHLGYEIKEAHRGNGYASMACLAAGSWIATLMDQIIITVDLDNVASIRTIGKIGARFIQIVDVPAGDPHYERGIRQKRLYHWVPQTTS